MSSRYGRDGIDRARVLSGCGVPAPLFGSSDPARNLRFAVFFRAMKGFAMGNSSSNLLTRSMHDIGLAAWFGGSLMGAVGVNGAAAQANDPKERLTLSSVGWAKWTPVQVVAIGAHVVGGLGQIGGNKKRVAADPSTQANSVIKTVVTAAAAGVSAYAGVLGKKVYENSDEGGQGATEPHSGASKELASAQKQLKVTQWAIPVLTGALLVLGAQQGEQQRGLRGLLDF